MFLPFLPLLVSGVPALAILISVILTIRKMREEMYVPRSAPLIAILITGVAVLLYMVLTGTQLNPAVAVPVGVCGLILGLIEGRATQLYYRGPIVVGKRTVGYLVIWGIAYILTLLLAQLQVAAFYAAGMMVLIFGFGVALGDNLMLLARQGAVKRQPYVAPVTVSAAAPAARPAQGPVYQQPVYAGAPAPAQVNIQLQYQPVPAQPVAQPTAPVAAPVTRKSGGGCGKVLGCGCLAVLLLLVCVVGGVVAVSTGVISQDTVLSLIGQGPGSIEYSNFADNTLHVTMTRLDVQQDARPGTPVATPSPSTLRLNAFDVLTYQVSQPSRLRVDFGSAEGKRDVGTCNLSVASGDAYQFVVLPDKVVVNRSNNPSSVGTDYVIDTSALCK
jgi:hypothetical protein